MAFNIWFDDGDLSIWEMGLPMLKRFGLKATVAIITGYIGKNYDLQRVQPCPFMDVHHLEELLDEGWEIASHSATHRHFTTLNEEEVLEELLKSKQWIIDNLGVEPKKFAFPADMATPLQIGVAQKYYEYVRPIPPPDDIHAIIHRITLSGTRKIVSAARPMTPELEKTLHLGGAPIRTGVVDAKRREVIAHESEKPDRWIFVSGCNNSGTTLIDYLLGIHPDIDPIKSEVHQIRIKGVVTSYPEGFILPSPAVIGRPDGKRLNRVWTENLPAFREPIVEVPILKFGIKACRKTTDGVYTMGKSPDLMVKMPWFQKRLPDSRFVIIVRNGYAVSEGIRRRFNLYLNPEKPFLQDVTGKIGYLKDEEPMTVARAARHWNKAHEVMLEDITDLKNYAVIRYEDFCRDPADMLNRLVDFFELPPFDYAPVVEKPIPIFKGYRKAIKIRNMNGESFTKLTTGDIADITREAEPMLKRFGYPVL